MGDPTKCCTFPWEESFRDGEEGVKVKYDAMLSGEDESVL